MPARISTIGFIICAILGSASSDIYTAVAIPSGTEMIMAPAVTISEPVKSGSRPNFGGVDVGYQKLPVMKERMG
jgi:hypothetical protein